VVVVLLALAACGGGEAGADASAATQTSSGGSVAWRPLGTWSGGGSRQTESFDVSSGALRLAWEATDEAESGAGHLRVSLHSAISGRVVAEVVDAAGSASDTAYFASEPRVAYLLIESDRVGWRLTLEEGLPKE